MRSRDIDTVDRQLVALRERMNRLFDESIASVRAGGRSTWNPAADVYRLDDRMVVTLELPGVEQEEVTVVATGGLLRVRGRRIAPSGGLGVLQLERGHGTFEREFSLPERAHAQRPSIKLRDGILRVEIALEPTQAHE